MSSVDLLGAFAATVRRVRDRWFVYVLRCGDGSFYTGIARDVQKRLAEHEAGKGARYTRGRGPLVLCASRACRGKGRALRIEYALKQLSRREKIELLAEGGLSRFARRIAARQRHKSGTRMC